MPLDESFLDITSNTNGTKKDPLRMVLKDSNGQTFIGNVRAILSWQHCAHAQMHTHFFIYLYGEVGFLHNILTLTDDDVSGWGPLEDCVATTPSFHDTKHMMSMFHARTLVSFQRMHPKLN